jgi:hypothetical protein
MTAKKPEMKIRRPLLAAASIALLLSSAAAFAADGYEGLIPGSTDDTRTQQQSGYEGLTTWTAPSNAQQATDLNGFIRQQSPAARTYVPADRQSVEAGAMARYKANFARKVEAMKPQQDALNAEMQKYSQQAQGVNQTIAAAMNKRKQDTAASMAGLQDMLMPQQEQQDGKKPPGILGGQTTQTQQYPAAR